MSRQDPHFSPGLLTPSGAEALQDLFRQVEITRKKVEELSPQIIDEFPAVLTSGSSGDHAWSEQTFNAGLRITKPSGRFGTTSFNPAVFADGSTATSFPLEVMLRRRNYAGTRGVVFEANTSTASSSSGGMTNVAYYTGTVDPAIDTGSHTIINQSGLTLGNYLLFGTFHCSATLTGTPASGTASQGVIVTPSGGASPLATPSNYSASWFWFPSGTQLTTVACYLSDITAFTFAVNFSSVTGGTWGFASAIGWDMGLYTSP